MRKRSDNRASPLLLRDYVGPGGRRCAGRCARTTSTTPTVTSGASSMRAGRSPSSAAGAWSSRSLRCVRLNPDPRFATKYKQDACVELLILTSLEYGDDTRMIWWCPYCSVITSSVTVVAHARRPRKADGKMSPTVLPWMCVCPSWRHPFLHRRSRTHVWYVCLCLRSRVRL